MHPFMRQISVTHRCAMRYREQELVQLGLSGSQIMLLTTLYFHPGISQEELARLLYVNKSNITRNLTGLEERGYIRRESDPEDRRSLLVYPTELALEQRETIRSAMRAWRDYLTQDFTEEEKETLSRLMIRIASRAEDYMKGADKPCAPSDDTYSPSSAGFLCRCSSKSAARWLSCCCPACSLPCLTTTPP